MDERFTHLDNVYYIITGKGVKQIKGEDTVANNGKGEIVDLVEPTADNKIQTETWLLAEYRNTLTGHVHYIPVESCEHAEWVLRCMNHHGKYEFVELYKKSGGD